MSRTKPQSETGEMEGAIVVALLDVASHLQRRGERLAQRGNLTTQQWMVLLEIAGDPSFGRARGLSLPTDGVLPSTIARGRGVSRATVSALVAELERQGLIRQIDDAEDRRRRRLQITAAGRRALAAIEPDRRRANRRLVAPLSASEQAALLDQLQRCLAVLLAE